MPLLHLTLSDMQEGPYRLKAGKAEGAAASTGSESKRFVRSAPVARSTGKENAGGGGGGGGGAEGHDRKVATGDEGAVTMPWSRTEEEPARIGGSAPSVLGRLSYAFGFGGSKTKTPPGGDTGGGGSPLVREASVTPRISTLDSSRGSPTRMSGGGVGWGGSRSRGEAPSTTPSLSHIQEERSGEEERIGEGRGAGDVEVGVGEDLRAETEDLSSKAAADLFELAKSGELQGLQSSLLALSMLGKGNY
jgi:hypothetical protein